MSSCWSREALSVSLCLSFRMNALLSICLWLSLMMLVCCGEWTGTRTSFNPSKIQCGFKLFYMKDVMLIERMITPVLFLAVRMFSALFLINCCSCFETLNIKIANHFANWWIHVNSPKKANLLHRGRPADWSIVTLLDVRRCLLHYCSYSFIRF